MTLNEVLDTLYDSEINFSAFCFWDNGIDVKLGDEMNDFSAEVNVRTASEAAAWLDGTAASCLSKVKICTPRRPNNTGRTVWLSGAA